MRILKNKIANSKVRQENAKQAKKAMASSLKLEKELSTSASSNQTIQPDLPQPKKRTRIAGYPVTTQTDRATKNIVKNYGKAICSFTCSYLATPYLTSLALEHNIELSEFLKFISNAKDGIESMSSFRNLLLVKDDDDQKTRKFKKIFATISEIFIKCFSVNWIFSGRLTYKDIHLKFRFKLLRRVRNPESFTYLSARSKKEML